jgi:AraC family transcriptional regulator
VIFVKVINEPELKELKEKTVAYISYVGNYVGKPEVFSGLFGKLFGWAFQNQAMRPDTEVLSAYSDDPKTTLPEEMSLEICMTIPEDFPVEGEVKKKVLPGGKYVVMRAEMSGPDEYGPGWEKVARWVSDNNLSMDLSRESYEIYLNNPEEHPEKKHIVDICLAVR